MLVLYDKKIQKPVQNKIKMRSPSMPHRHQKKILQMFKVLIVLAFLLNVSAFITSQQPRSHKTLAMKFDDAIGAQPPLGFWDPLGLLKDADQVRFDRLRYVETKHGRIAMLAILGHLVTTAGVRLPGDIAYGLPFAKMKTGLAAFETIPPAGLAQIFAFIGLLELGFNSRQAEIEEAQIKASGWDQETLDRKLAIELNNGRAAQMGILGLMIHESLNNDPYVINTLLGAPIDFNAGL